MMPPVCSGGKRRDDRSFFLSPAGSGGAELVEYPVSLRERWRLTRAGAEDMGVGAMKKRKTIGLAVLVLLGLVFWSVFRESHGVGVDSVEWLPREAHNITYLKNDLIAIAEFDIEQEAFQKWCERGGWSLRELTGAETCAVGRCLPYLESRGIIPVSDRSDEVAGSDDGIELASVIDDHFSKAFGAGDLFFEERWDNGGGYTIGYDVEEGRGYYDFSRH